MELGRKRRNADDALSTADRAAIKASRSPASLTADRIIRNRAVTTCCRSEINVAFLSIDIAPPTI